MADPPIDEIDAELIRHLQLDGRRPYTQLAREVGLSEAAVRNLIRENKIAQIGSALQTGQQYGMQTLDKSLQQLVRTGAISQEVARSKAQNADFM